MYIITQYHIQLVAFTDGTNNIVAVSSGGYRNYWWLDERKMREGLTECDGWGFPGSTPKRWKTGKCRNQKHYSIFLIIYPATTCVITTETREMLLSCYCHGSGPSYSLTFERRFCGLQHAETLMFHKMTTDWKAAFCVAGPAAWNNLHVQTSETLTVFKSSLETHLFVVSHVN